VIDGESEDGNYDEVICMQDEPEVNQEEGERGEVDETKN